MQAVDDADEVWKLKEAAGDKARKEKKQRRRLLAWLCCGCCIPIALALGIGLGLGLRRRHPSPPPPLNPPPPSPLPGAPQETALPESVPTVLLSLSLFGSSLDAAITASGGTSVVTSAVAAAIGAAASQVSMARPLEYLLQFTIALPGASAALVTGAAVKAAVLSALPAAASTTLNVAGINSAGGIRRALLSTVEVTLQAYSTTLTMVTSLNASLAKAVADSSLSTALQAASISVSGVTLPSPPAPGLQLGLAISCPVGNTSITPAAAAAAFSPAAFVNTSAALVLALNQSGLSGVSGLAVTLAPIIGACLRALVSGFRSDNAA